MRPITLNDSDILSNPVVREKYPGLYGLIKKRYDTNYESSYLGGVMVEYAAYMMDESLSSDRIVEACPIELLTEDGAIIKDPLAKEKYPTLYSEISSTWPYAVMSTYFLSPQALLECMKYFAEHNYKYQW